MTEPTAKLPRLPLNAWRIQALRLTTFHMSLEGVDLPSMYRSVLDRDPETEVRQREGYQSEGAFQTGKMILVVPNLVGMRRVDWLATQLSGEEAPLLGESLRLFIDTLRPWLTQSPPVRRLAAGAVLVTPVRTKAIGYGQLQAYLPAVTIDPVRSTDLLYQINRPRDTATPVEGLVINRLSKWQVPVVVDVDFVGLAPTISAAQNEVCQVELDINTSPQFTQDLPREHLGAIIDELAAAIIEQVRDGDRP